MARPLRLEGFGYWFHVTGRGNARGRLFLQEEDRRRFVGLLSQLEARYGLGVHCYVLMSNHYHLLLRMKTESGLSAGMQWLGVSYTVWFNRRHRRSGHLRGRGECRLDLRPIVYPASFLLTLRCYMVLAAASKSFPALADRTNLSIDFLYGEDGCRLF